MKFARIILLFPLAFFRLIMVLLISMTVAIAGWFWLKVFGFSRKLQHWTCRSWGRLLLFFLGIRVNRNEIPADNHFILMPNHRSYIDIFIVARYTPAAFVAKAEIKNWPFLNLGARLTNSVFVARTDINSRIETMKKIEQSVKSKIPVAIFPEGTTSKGPLTKPFKNGSFKIAADSGIPVIPMAIHYNDANDSWIDDDTFVGHFFRQMSKPVTKVQICYGTPLQNFNFRVLQNETREQIDSMLKIMAGKNIS